MSRSSSPCASTRDRCGPVRSDDLLLYLTGIVDLLVRTAGIVLTVSGVASLAVPAASAALSARFGARGIVTALTFAVAPSLPWLLTSALALLACLGTMIAGRSFALQDR